MKQKIHSISKRLSQRILVVFILTTTFLALLIITLASIVIRNMTNGYFLSELQVLNESIEKKLYGVEMVTANTLNILKDHIDTPEDVFTIFKDKLDPNEKLISGFGAAFEPYYFPSQGKWFEPYVYRYNDSISQQQIGSPQHDYFNKEWYQKALTAKKGYWSAPYYDDAVSKKNMCSYFLPIINKENQRVGVFGADFILDRLYNEMKKVDAKINEYNPLLPEHAKEEEDKDIWAYSIIIDKDGSYIYHPDKELILKGNFFDDILQSPKSDYHQLTLELASGKKGSQKITVGDMKSYAFYSRVKNTNWSNLIIVPREGMQVPSVIVGLILLTIIVLGLLVAYAICRVTIHRSTKPLQLLAESADEVAKGNFHTALPELKYNDEISQLRDSFSNMQQSLTQYIAQLKTTTAQKAAIDYELNIAHEIQLAMLPKEFPERSDIDIYASLKPAKAVGGDLYDFTVRDDQLIFCIGDVSGKGVPAALLMMVTKSLFRAYSSNENNPDRIVSQMNKDLTWNNEACMFVTFFVGVLDLHSGELRYCNAGHMPPIVINKEASPLPVCHIFPIGAYSETSYKMQTAVIEPQSTILFYTDGLNEALNANGTFFGEKRITKEVNHAIQAGQLSPQTLIERMTQAVHNFVGETEQSDDLTMFALKWK